MTAGTWRADGPELLFAWLALTLAGAFTGFAFTVGPVELQHAESALASYLRCVNPAAGGAAIACAGLYWTGSSALLARVTLAAALCYLGAFVVVGWWFAPWCALAALAIAFLRSDRALKLTPLLLLVHGMGTLTALYLVFRLNKYLSGWDQFVDVLRSLRQLLAG